LARWLRADGQGDFHWAAPDAEVHAFINDLERPIVTYLYGRRLYETMAGWGSAQFSVREHLQRAPFILAELEEIVRILHDDVNA
jgi:hypothetical protein